jgi:hypothetical protein
MMRPRALAGVLGFAIDQRDHFLRQIERRHQQRIVASGFPHTPSES